MRRAAEFNAHASSHAARESTSAAAPRQSGFAREKPNGRETQYGVFDAAALLTPAAPAYSVRAGAGRLVLQSPGEVRSNLGLDGNVGGRLGPGNARRQATWAGMGRRRPRWRG